MKDVTTIPLEQETKQELLKLRNHSLESYNEQLLRFIRYFKEEMEENILTPKDLKDITKSIKEYEKGHFKTQEQMEKKYGLK